MVSNQYEEEIARIYIKRDIPILGICSGSNNLIKALGGSVRMSSNILKSQKLIVNSIHTYVATEENIKEYKIVAKCPLDNTVEAIELENKRFVMGIKWHPELMESMNLIFEKFVEECDKKYDI